MRRRGGGGAPARAARTIAGLCAAALALAAGVAAARDVVGRGEVELSWARAEGDVAAYGVFVSRDGGPYRSEQYTREPRARVPGRAGETVRVRVRAYGVAGERTLTSEPSEPSEPITFVAPAPGAAAVSTAPPAPAPWLASMLVPPLAVQAAGDFDGDGRPDLFATLGSWEQPRVLYAKNGWFEALAPLPSAASATAAFAADFDGDGRDELAVRDAGGVSLLRLDGSAASLLRRESLPPGATALAADLDGDGSASLLVYDPASRHLTQRIAPGQTRDFGAIPSLHALRAGDFDGDGRDDLWIRTAPDAAELWLMREGGRFEVAQLPFDGALEVAATGDWNGDGRDDLVVFDPVHDELSVWLLDGARVLDRRALGRGPMAALRVLDLDGNGRPDLLVSAPDGSSRVVLGAP